MPGDKEQRVVRYSYLADFGWEKEKGQKLKEELGGVFGVLEEGKRRY